MDYTSIKVGQLPTADISGGNFIPHEVSGLLKKATITDLAAFINASGAVGFRAVSISDGGTLPTTDTNEFILVGPGTYNNVEGASPITVTEELNALVSNGDYWFIGVEIPIDAPPGDAIWGEIVGTLSNQTDLQNVLNLKADLVDGKVPAAQLPSYVDDIIEVANFASLPATGETGKIYLTLDNNKIYRWSGSVYIEIAAENAVWGQIVGTLSNQTDLQSALNAKVPYTGATANVDLGTHTLSSYNLVVNHTSGSGVAAQITKGGNGEALTVVKSSGSGNAASITGGVTLLSELHLNTDLADAYIASAAIWNAKQDALNGTGFVKISGTTISYDNSTYALDSVVVKLTGNQTIEGVKTFTSQMNAAKIIMSNTSLDSSLELSNSSSGQSISVTNTGSGNAIQNFNNGNTGVGFMSANSNTATGNLYQGNYNGSRVFSVGSEGNGYFSDSIRIANISTPSLSWDLKTFGSQFQIVDVNGNSTRFVISANGNVGIGTTSPAASLDVTGTSSSIFITDNLASIAEHGFQFNASGIGLRGGLTINYSNGEVKHWAGIATNSYFQTFHTNGSERMRITSDGFLLIGTTLAFNPGVTLSPNGTIGCTSNGFENMQLWNRATSGNNLFSTFYTEGGGGVLRGSIDYNRAAGLVRYNVTSDYRLKTDLKEFNANNIIDKIKVYDYKLKETGSRVYGVMAHELQETIPYCVSGEKDGEKMQGVDYSLIVPILVQAIKELKAEIEILKNK